LSAAVTDGRLSDIGAAVERRVRRSGDYGIVKDYVGHGIGSQMHMNPSVPNYATNRRRPKLRSGMALAIEPMVVMGDAQVSVLEDDWTVVTDDGSWAAHWEHTVAITAAGPWVLTAHDGGAKEFAKRGVVSPAL
jgi:methionyl aminopeptidase